MKTFKLVLLIVVLLTTAWLMVEGIKINLLPQSAELSSTTSKEQNPVQSAVLLK